MHASASKLNMPGGTTYGNVGVSKLYIQREFMFKFLLRVIPCHIIWPLYGRILPIDDNSSMKK